MDYVTLCTCTPYGVNSHRLLVRGVRTSDTEEENTNKDSSVEDANGTKVESQWMKEYKKALIAGVSIAALIMLIFAIIQKCKR